MNELSIANAATPNPNEGLSATFVLSGPSKHWKVNCITRISYLGHVRRKFTKTKLELRKLEDLKVTVAPRYYYPDRSSLDELTDPHSRLDEIFHRSRGLLEQAEQMAIWINSKETENKENFYNKASEVANDLMLLMSFVSRRHIRCHLVHLHEKGSRRDLLKNVDTSAPTHSVDSFFGEDVLWFGHGPSGLSRSLGGGSPAFGGGPGRP